MSMERIPIRTRLTVAFSAALLIVLGLAAAFVLIRVDASLTESSDETLSVRLAALTDVVASASPAEPPTLPSSDPDDYEDNFTQILEPDGTVVASTLPRSSGAALTPAEAGAAAEGEGEGEGEGEILIEQRDIPAVDGDARVMATAAAGEAGSEWIVVAGTSNQDREETLHQIAAAFAVGAPVALLIAALAGYGLARRALRPVERMRAQAAAIEPGSTDRLTVPAADDELRSLGMTLNSMLERQTEALERERAFVADASHELRTPLAVLRAELEVAELEGGSPEQLRAAIHGALNEVDRLARLSDDLLVIATADHGRVPIHRERVRTADLLDRVTTRFRRTAADAGRAIRAGSSGGETCTVDPLRVEQALGNLVDNALRYGAGDVSIEAHVDDGALEVLVADEGPGFPDDVADNAFERFARSSRDRGGNGAGLGLSIVRAIAEAHGGEARIESRTPAAIRATFR